MFPSLRKVIAILDEVAPFALAEQWDNSGLQVGSLDQIIKKILVALDPTYEAVSRAASADAQLLITHHPLLFRAVSCIDLNIYPGDVIREAIKRDVAIVAVHTNLDSARMGISYSLARDIGLTGVDVLEPRVLNGEEGYGIGLVGNLAGPVKLLSVSRLIKYALGINRVKVIGPDESVIERIAIVGGSGGDYIEMAVQKNADLLITGDIGHHDALKAKTMNINVIDAGHFSTERAALTGFIKNLEEIFERNKMSVNLELYGEETDPSRTI
jgi:dinuclear metal center YbgI/SA1388 family protein